MRGPERREARSNFLVVDYADKGGIVKRLAKGEMIPYVVDRNFTIHVMNKNYHFEVEEAAGLQTEDVMLYGNLHLNAREDGIYATAADHHHSNPDAELLSGVENVVGRDLAADLQEQLRASDSKQEINE